MKIHFIFAAGIALTSCASDDATLEQTSLLKQIQLDNQTQNRAMMARLAVMEERLEKLDAQGKTTQALCKTKTDKRPGQEEQKKAIVFPKENSPVLGKKNAKLSVVVFSDIQCPYCAKLHPVLNALVKDPALKQKVNVIYKHFPLSFHARARPAALAAEAARAQGEGYFWQFIDAANEEQRDLSDARFLKIAQNIGLDVKRFKRDLEKNAARYEAWVKRDIGMGQEVANVRGTPSIFIGGWRYTEGVRSVPNFKAFMNEKGLL